MFNKDLYRDVKDIFGKNNSQRQFYTVPGNQVPNDQGAFAQWCYGMPRTYKEGNQIAFVVPSFKTALFILIIS